MILYEFVLFLLNAPWILSIFCMLISEPFFLKRILLKKKSSPDMLLSLEREEERNIDLRNIYQLPPIHQGSKPQLIIHKKYLSIYIKA